MKMTWGTKIVGKLILNLCTPMNSSCHCRSWDLSWDLRGSGNRWFLGCCCYSYKTVAFKLLLIEASKTQMEFSVNPIHDLGGHQFSIMSKNSETKMDGFWTSWKLLRRKGLISSWVTNYDRGVKINDC